MIVSLPGFRVASMIGGLAITRRSIPPIEQGQGCPSNELQAFRLVYSTDAVGEVAGLLSRLN